MAPRALGALLAIVAAVAFAVSIASSAWWAGHPTVEGQTIQAKDVGAGPLGATGCNTGGDGSCEALTTTGTVQLVGLAATITIGVAILFAFMLAISAWRVGDRRKGLARATIIVTLMAAGVGAVLLAMGPGIVEGARTIAVPIGWGTYVLGGAVVSSLIASAIARKLEPEPLRLKSGGAPPPAPPDVRDLVRQDHDGLAPRDSIPLFGSAPQLRPLYDPSNQGYVPAPQSPTSLPMQPPAPYPRHQVKALTGQDTPTPEKVNPLGSPNPGVRRSPSAPPPLPLGAPMPRPGDPLGPPVDPFARTAPREQGGAPPPMSPPPRRGPPPAQPSRTKGQSAAPPPSRGPGASVAPPSRTQSPSTPPRTQSPSTPPRSTTPRVNVPQPPRTSSPGASTTPAPQRARTELGPGTDPMVRKLDTPAPEPDLRPSAPTIAHAIPPMPTPDNQTPPSVLPARDVTAVEIDSEAKAVAEATARGQLDPRIAPRTPRTATDARTGQHEARIADVTSTGVDVDSAPRGAATTGSNVIAPPAPSQRIITGGNRMLSTLQRDVARAPTEDPFQSGKAHQLVPADPLSDELDAPQSAEMAGEDGPNTEVHSIPSAEELAHELASQSASGSIGDVTAATSPPIDLHEYKPAPETTPIPTFHGSRPASASMSTASASLPPPRTVETAPHGPTPACPQCESPMAWVEEHLRFYCKQCRMYF